MIDTSLIPRVVSMPGQRQADTAENGDRRDDQA
jgi:hypothetical protein